MTTHLILAAGRGSRIPEYTSTIPKSKLPVSGTTIIDHQIHLSNSVLSTSPIIATGYLAESFLPSDAYSCLFYPHWNETNMLGTLIYCLKNIKTLDSLLVTYGDCYYKRPYFESLSIDSRAHIHLPLMSDWREHWERRYEDPLSDLETLTLDNSYLTSIGDKPSSFEQVHGQFSGSFIIPSDLLIPFVALAEELFELNKNADITSLLAYILNHEYLISTHLLPPSCCYEVDTVSDYNYLLESLA